MGAVQAEPTDFELPTTVDDIDSIEVYSDSVDIQSTPSENVVAEARGEVTERHLSELEEIGGSVVQSHDSFVEVRIDTGNRYKYANLPWVANVRSSASPVPESYGMGAESIGADEVQDTGVTGENISVAVIDTGFSPDNHRIADNVADTETFGTGSIDANMPHHGTASAEMVIDVAPDVDLYLASVSSDIGYMNAVDWAMSKDVDVTTVSMGFLGLRDDGLSDASLKTDEAVEEGGMVVSSSTGNSAKLHWTGVFQDMSGNGLMEYEEDSEINFFVDETGSPIDFSSGDQISADISWDDWNTTSSNYNLYILRVESPDEDPEIVDSADYNSTGFEPTKRLSTTVPESGFYGIGVEKTAGDDEELRIHAHSSAPRDELLYSVPEGSIRAPATAEEAMGIAAFRYDTREIEPYSSRGPTRDGRPGVSVTAPTCSQSSAYNGPYCGTSGASPHAGGVAALAMSTTNLTAYEIRDVLETTADDMPDGMTVNGHGAVNATAAVETAIETDYSPPDENESDLESPVEGVSDELWQAVTGGDGLSLQDLGTAIQTYQSDPENATVEGEPIGLAELGSLIQHYQSQVAG